MNHPVEFCVLTKWCINVLEAVNKGLIDEKVKDPQAGVRLGRKQLVSGIKTWNIFKACWNLVDKFDLGVKDEIQIT